jgi:hypothetical protein
MSDSLFICNRILSRDAVTMPRYYDLTKEAKGQKEKEKSPDEIIASVKKKANALRGETA